MWEGQAEITTQRHTWGAEKDVHRHRRSPITLDVKLDDGFVEKEMPPQPHISPA